MDGGCPHVLLNIDGSSVICKYPRHNCVTIFDIREIMENSVLIDVISICFKGKKDRNKL